MTLTRLTAVVAAGSLLLAPLMAASASTLTLASSSPQVFVGDSVHVVLEASGFLPAALGGYDIDIGFDPALFSFQSVAFGDPVLGDQLDLLHLGMSFPTATPTFGNVNLFEVSIDSTSTLQSHQAATFAIADLTFFALKPGIGVISPAFNSLINANGSEAIAIGVEASVQVVSSVPLPLSLPLLAGVLPLLLTSRPLAGSGPLNGSLQFRKPEIE